MSKEMKKRLLSPAASVETKEHRLSLDPDEPPAKKNMRLSPSKFSIFQKSDNQEPNAKGSNDSATSGYPNEPTHEPFLKDSDSDPLSMWASHRAGSISLPYQR